MSKIFAPLLLISSALLSLALHQPVLAQVVVEVAGVAGRGIPISFIALTNSPENTRFNTTLSHDLHLSGLFEIVNSPQTSALPYSAWRGYAYIAVIESKVEALDANNWRSHVKIHDPAQNKIVAELSFQGDSASLLAHRTADAIQEKLSGIAGVSSSRIAYVSRFEGRFYLYAAFADGSEPIVLVNSKEPLMSPAWSPDGNELAYVSFERGRAYIFVQNLKTKTRRTLAQFPGTNSAPSWSPDGKTLAFVSSSDGATHIYTMNASGGDAQALTSGKDIYTEPKFSRDGKSIFFTSDRGGSPQIYQMDLASKKITRLTFEGNYNVSPRPSPDGKYLAFITLRDKKFQLFVTDLESKTEFRLSETTGDESVAFAPNSKNLILSTRNKGQRQLLRVSLFGRPSPKIPSASPPSDVSWGPMLP